MKSLLLWVLSVMLVATVQTQAADDRFGEPGILEPNLKGYTGTTVYFPGIRFPIEEAPAFINSQIYGPGGYLSDSGNHPDVENKQCAEVNYSYPWRDDYCEPRGWSVALCPNGTGHQGEDIRPGQCRKDFFWAVAVADGIIASVGKYSVTLQTPSGTLYRYLHLNMGDLAVRRLDKVKRGDRIGLVSDWFGGAATTTHLHFDVKDTVKVNGKLVTGYISPYTSLVVAYKALLAGQP